MRHAARVSCILACAAVACAAPFRAGAPVQVEKHWYGTAYTQDGRQMTPLSLADGLAVVDVSREDARAARGRIAAGMGFAIVGGAATGYGLGSAMNGGCSRECVAIAGAGLGALAIGVALDVAGRGRLDRAVQAYNGRKPASASRPVLVPWAAPLAAAEDRGGIAGVAFQF